MARDGTIKPPNNTHVGLDVVKKPTLDLSLQQHWESLSYLEKSSSPVSSHATTGMKTSTVNKINF